MDGERGGEGRGGEERGGEGRGWEGRGEMMVVEKTRDPVSASQTFPC